MYTKCASWGGDGTRRIYSAWRGREAIPRLAKRLKTIFCEVIKVDGLGKSPSSRMYTQCASWGGGGTRRIYSAWRGITPMA